MYSLERQFIWLAGSGHRQGLSAWGLMLGQVAGVQPQPLANQQSSHRDTLRTQSDAGGGWKHTHTTCAHTSTHRAIFMSTVSGQNSQASSFPIPTAFPGTATLDSPISGEEQGTPYSPI